MARGQETDLLFNPPRIRKSSLTFLLDHGKLPEAAQDFFSTNYYTVLRDRLGNLRILDENYRAETEKSQRVTESSALTASDELLVFGDANGFTIRDFFRQGIPSSFKPGLGHTPGGLHISRQELFEVHYLEEGNMPEKSIVISKTPLSRDDNSGWKLEEKYETSSEEFSFMHKGEKSLLIFRDEHGRQTAIVFDEHGADRPLLITTRIGTALSSKREPLVTPGEKRGSYFSVSFLGVEGGSELSFTEPVNGLVHEEPIIELDPEDDIHDLTSRGNRGLLLTSKELILFSARRGGVERVWSLEDIEEKYNRLIWNKDDEALLWQVGGGNVQKINLANP